MAKKTKYKSIKVTQIVFEDLEDLKNKLQATRFSKGNFARLSKSDIIGLGLTCYRSVMGLKKRGNKI